MADKTRCRKTVIEKNSEGRCSTRKGNMIRRIATGLMAVAMMATVTFTEVPVVQAEESSTDWMADIPGDTMLSSISIPGTHDSTTQYISLSYILQCQNTSVAQQLDDGYRYIDVRLEMDEVDDQAVLKLVHNMGDCRIGKSIFSEKMYLNDVLSDIYDFLDEHPTETVMFAVKAENEDDNISDFQSLLYEYINADANYWYLANEIPSLDDVRGKIVLATRFDDANGVGEMSRGLNFQWEDQGDKEVVDVPYVLSMINETHRLWVQDRYKYNIETKTDAVLDDLMNCQADVDTFSINFLSTAGSGYIGHPKKYAKAINATVLETDLSENTSYGIVVVDFGTAEMAQHIYETNFSAK